MDAWILSFIAEVEKGHAGKTRELVMAIQAAKYDCSAVSPELEVARFSTALNREASATGRNRLLRSWLAEHKSAVAVSWTGLGFPAAPQSASSAVMGRVFPAVLPPAANRIAVPDSGVAPVVANAMGSDVDSTTRHSEKAAQEAEGYPGLLIFDFDQTLITRHMSYFEDMDRIVDRAFGGAARLELLREMFEGARAGRVAVAVVTRNSRDLIRKALGRVGLMQFITEGMVFGMENYNTDDASGKSKVVRELLVSCLGCDGKTSQTRALFVDDDISNIHDMQAALPFVSTITAPATGIAHKECNMIVDWVKQLGS